MSKPDKYFYTTLDSNGTFIGICASLEENHAALQAVFDLLKSRGWTIQTDQEVLKRYPILANDHFEGQKGDLRFKAEQNPAISSLEFYQEINTKNPHGGKYDFDKLLMMPYLLRCQFLTELKHIKNLLIVLGYVDNSEPVLKTAKEIIDHYKENHRRDIDKVPDYYATDMDGKRMSDGEVKYFRDRKGRLMRGTVYYNINNMWWVLINKHWYTNLACFELFDLSEKNNERKIIKRSGHHNPKSRWMPTPEELKKWQANAKAIGTDGRLKTANKFLKYLYSIDWVTRCFNFSFIEFRSKVLSNIVHYPAVLLGFP